MTSIFVLLSIYKENQKMNKKELDSIKKKWMNLNQSEKAFVVEILIMTHPNKTLLLKEDRWWNTVGDILGIFDPTGVIDLVNGLDYIRQGDYLFGFLSMVSAIPYVGDAIAKPLIGVGKAGRYTKGATEAMKIVKNGGNISDAAKLLEDSAKSSKLFDKLVRSVPSWGSKLKNALDNLPASKLTGGLRKTIKGWIDLFENVAKRRLMAGKLTGIMASKLTKPMSKSEAISAINALQKQLKVTGKPFAKMTFRKGDWFGKYIAGGMTFTGLFGRNRALTSLANRSKFYLGFLDFLGLGNWKGPEELTQEMGEKKIEEKYQEYVKTPQAKENWDFDISEVPEDVTPKSTEKLSTPSTATNKPTDPLSDFLGSLFTQAA